MEMLLAYVCFFSLSFRLFLTLGFLLGAFFLQLISSVDEAYSQFDNQMGVSISALEAQWFTYDGFPLNFPIQKHSVFYPVHIVKLWKEGSYCTIN